MSPSNGVTISSSSLIANISTTVLLNCSGLGGPGNAYKWSTGQNTSTLQFTVNNGTADGGTYTCIVTNAAGNGSASATLYVPPTFITQPSDTLAVMNDTVTLVCEAEAFPPPQYMWEHIGGNLTGKAYVSGISSNRLVLSGVMFGDEGSYRCTVASNGTMITSRTAILTCKFVYYFVICNGVRKLNDTLIYLGPLQQK